ncbi:hypothetical protein ACIQ6R_18175 [Streptomyces sp. NPDC096048]|uniref:hypothetical protein n=1 Tax=Streptomyces sp. NPDC096048 TaxID=3366072 RepID=UPI003816CB80
MIAGGNPFAATGAGAMKLQIGVGRAIAQGTDAQGAYPVCLDAPVTIDFPDGDAQFARIDSVAVRVYDGLYNVEGQTIAVIERVPGEARSDPQAPDMPSGAVRLWDVIIPAGTSAGVGGIDWGVALADRRRFTSSYGGIIPRGWGLGFDGAYDGQYRDNGGELERWNATAGVWELYRPPPAPRTVITTGFAVTSGWSLVTFDARRSGDGQTVSVSIEIRRTGAALPSDPNLGDVVVGTLPSGWAPSWGFEAQASDGYGFGAAYLSPNRSVTLRSWSPGVSIGTGANLRISQTYVQ